MNINIKYLLTTLFALLLALIFYQRVIQPWQQSREILTIREFDADEFQHSHAAWYLSKGDLPYRDYFEHHTPLLYFQLAPVLSYLKPETSFEAAKSAFIILRQIMSLWVACTLILVIAIGWVWIGSRRGLLVGVSATALLANMPYFWSKMLEIRPDVPAVTFFLAAVLLMLVGLKTNCNTDTKFKTWILKVNLRILFVAGLLLSIATLHTQKVLFIGPGITLFWTWYVIDPRWEANLKKRILQFCSVTFGFFIPIFLISLYFAYHNGLFEFYYYNLIFNLKWQTRFDPYDNLKGIWESSKLVVSMAVTGYTILLIRCATKASQQRLDALILFIAGSALTSLWINPEPYLQSYQYLLPFVALFAATFMTSFFYTIAKISLYSLNYILTLTARLNLAVQQKGIEALTIATILQCSLVYYQTPDLKSLQVPKILPEVTRLTKIEWVMRNTSVDDLVVDDWPVYGVFRKHGWYYWCTHGALFKMIPTDELNKYEDGLIKGLYKPKLHTNAGFYNSMSKKAKNYLQNNYTLTPAGYWIRNDY